MQTENEYITINLDFGITQLAKINIQAENLKVINKLRPVVEFSL